MPEWKDAPDSQGLWFETSRFGEVVTRNVSVEDLPFDRPCFCESRYYGPIPPDKGASD